MTSAVIRPMTTADYDAVRALWEQTEGVGLNESDEREAVARYLERNPGLSFVAEAGGEIIGAVLCGHEGRRGYLNHLAVAALHRRNGLGRRLVAACLEQLRAAQITRCNLFVYPTNTAGSAFWERLGFAMRTDLAVMQGVTESPPVRDE